MVPTAINFIDHSKHVARWPCPKASFNGKGK